MSDLPEPPFCTQCGVKTTVRSFRVGYDRQTGEPVYRHEARCYRGWKPWRWHSVYVLYGNQWWGR